MMGGKIDAYLDCVSPYSYYAFLYLTRNREALLSHGVVVEFIPVFLGGINVGSGNKPPWTLPAKKTYANFDSKRAQKYFGAKLTTPDFFPILSLLPQRCMVYIKYAYPSAKYEASFCELWIAMFEQQKDISKQEIMAEVLSKHFQAEDIDTILKSAQLPPCKQQLNENTKTAVESGAFGCPWFEVTNAKGEKEPFFGSDRFHFMWEFLGLPWQDISIREKSKM